MFVKSKTRHRRDSSRHICRYPRWTHHLGSIDLSVGAIEFPVEPGLLPRNGVCARRFANELSNARVVEFTDAPSLPKQMGQLVSRTIISLRVPSSEYNAMNSASFATDFLARRTLENGASNVSNGD